VFITGSGLDSDLHDIVFCIGVTTMFPYLARPVLVAKSEGVPTVEIGTQNMDLSETVDFRFKGSPLRVLDLIVDAHQISSCTSAAAV
jgi:NAD-dependent deacetylase